MTSIARTALVLLVSLALTTASIYVVAALALDSGSYWLPGTNSSQSVADYAGESSVRFVRLRGTFVTDVAQP